MPSMTEHEIIKMCQKVAYKYNRPEDFEDMVQEAVLACYELLAIKDEPHPAELYRAAQKRVYDYVNFDLHGLSIPASDTARSVSRNGEAGQSSSWSDEAVDHLTMVLHSEWGEYDDEMVDGNYKNAEALLLEKQERQELLDAICEVLSDEEMKIIRLRYFEGMTQDMVAKTTDQTYQSVSKKEQQALSKLKKRLCNNLLLEFL